jgi:hypothetical protein
LKRKFPKFNSIDFVFQISAQESRRKKKEYVDALEKEIAKYIDENKALKERMSTIEKNQK